MIVTGMSGTEIKRESGPHGFVSDFRVNLGEMLFLEHWIEEKEAAGDAGALGQQMIRPLSCS